MTSQRRDENEPLADYLHHPAVVIIDEHSLPNFRQDTSTAPPRYQ